MRRLAPAAVVIGIAFFSLLTWYTGNEPWFDPLLSIDGQSYAQGMIDIGAKRDFVHLKDLYHSPGYQLYLGGLYALCGPRTIFRWIKALTWLLAVACILMIFWLGENYFGAYVGSIAAILLAFSSKWAAYINLLQYEVPLAFSLTALAFAFVAIQRRPRFKTAAVLAASCCLIAASFIHFRMLVLIPFAGWVLWKQRAGVGLVLLLVAPPLAAAGAWSVYQSRRLGRLVLIQDMKPWAEQFRMHNHPGAEGYAFPYIDSVEPSGGAFILRRPARYVWLMKERFLYLWDFRKDLWYIGPPPSPADIVLRLAACLAFFCGFALKLRDDLRRADFWQQSPPYFIVAVALAGPLLSTGSSRFLVPILPFVCLFQAYAVVRVVGGLVESRRRTGSRLCRIQP